MTGLLARLAMVPRRVWGVAGGCAMLALVLVVCLANCGADPQPPASKPGAAGTGAAQAFAPEPSPTLPPPTNTDGCKGLVTPAQVAKASGLTVTPTPGDAAGAADQYAQAVHGMGLTATVRMCPFGNAAGDQVTVVALAFPDATQAGRLFQAGQGAAALKPVGGGDVAVSDSSKTLLLRKGKAVVAVYLVVAAHPDADHLGAMQSLASAALAKAG